MARVRDRTSGSGVIKGASKEGEGLLALSLQGKWVSVARAWIEQNYPCKVTDYIVQVSSLMPTHIMHSSKRASQMHLAKDALRRIPVNIQDGVITGIREVKNKKKYDHESTLRNFLGDDGLVRIPKIASSKEMLAFATWLRRRATRVDVLTYKLNGGNET